MDGARVHLRGDDKHQQGDAQPLHHPKVFIGPDTHGVDQNDAGGHGHALNGPRAQLDSVLHVIWRLGARVLYCIHVGLLQTSLTSPKLISHSFCM